MTSIHRNASRSRLRLAPAELAVVAFNLLYLAVALVASLRRGNTEFLLYFAVLCGLLVLMAAIHFKIRFSLALLWGLSVWGLAHMAGGLVAIPEAWPTGGEGHVLYNLWLVPNRLKFDQLVHAYGFGLVTIACWQGLQHAFASRGVCIRPTLGLLTLCIAGGMGFGAANEVVEFIATRVLPETNVGGYENTGWDLVANLIGCWLAATGLYLWPNNKAD
jgi:hypothetical protein